MKYFSLYLSIVVCMFISTAHADYDIYRYDVFVGPNDQTNPDIDGDIVVWVGSDNNIYWKQMDQSNANMIATGGIQSDPKISDTIVVWYDNDTYRNVYGYDLQTDDFLYITDESTKQWKPDVSGKYVVYEHFDGAYNIYLYDDTLGTSDVIESQTTHQLRPAIDGDLVVWGDGRNDGYADYDIYYCDISQTPPTAYLVSGSAGDQWNPAVSGSLIVWREDPGDGTGFNIYGYDLNDPATGRFPICTASGNQEYPAISGTIVVWEDWSEGTNSYDIWAIDLADMTAGSFEVSDGTGNNQSPAVFVNTQSGKKTIVWDHNGNIVAADLLIPTEIDVTRPVGGESFWIGDSMQIEWTATGPVDEVLIEFSSDNGTTWIDVNTVPDTGSYLWAPVAAADSDNCLVKISNTVNSSVFDISGSFAVHPIPDEIAVISPNGGEMVLAGGEMLITWGLVSGTAPAAVDITFDDGISVPMLVAEDIPFDDTQYLWADVADVNSLNACSIQISDADDGDPADVSDAAFSVFQCDQNLTADLTGDCFVDIADIAELTRQWLECGNPHDPTWCFMN